MIKFCSWVFLGLEWRALGIFHGGAFLLLIPLVLFSGGIALAAFEYFFPGEVLGYGFPDFLAMLHVGGGRIKRHRIFLEATGAALSLGAGASVGRESPIAQIGGLIGAAIAKTTRLTPDRAKVLAACGAGAGIATTFNAPIGGLFFAQEIVLLGETGLSDLTLLIIATTAGVIVSGATVGEESVFRAQPFELRSYWELVTYSLMGLAMGVLSAGYIRLFHATAGFLKSIELPAYVKLWVGLLLVGLIAIPLPRNLSDGYPAINEALAGGLPAAQMAALAVAKIFASTISLGCGAPGGVFGPTFFIGAMAGGTFRWLSAVLFPQLTGPHGILRIDRFRDLPGRNDPRSYDCCVSALRNDPW